MMLPRIKVSLISGRNTSKRKKVVTGFVIMSAMVFLWIEGTSGALQPNLTSVEAWSETQIKVTWQPFDYVDSNDKPQFYELYIDEHLEYFGNDVVYIARRLTPDTTYHFKLRSCVQQSYVCSLFSKTLSGTTNQSRRRGFTKSFIQWTILCLVITISSCATALLGAKLTRRLWRSFLYRYDYRSETNLQLPKYVAGTDTIDEDVMSSLCLKTLPKTDERNLSTSFKKEKKNDNSFANERILQKSDLSTIESARFDEQEKCAKKKETFVLKSGIRKPSESIEHNYNANMSTTETDIDPLKFNKSKYLFKGEVSEEPESCLNDRRKHSKSLSIENTAVPTVETNCELLDNRLDKNIPKDGVSKSNAKLPCNGTTVNERFTIQRAHTSPKITTDFKSKKKNEGHRRTLSLDSNVQNKTQHDLSMKCQKNTKHVATPHSTLAGIKLSCDVVIVVDNSNVFIGAQECATLLNANERKRNIRIKIQQLVKVFQRGRVVSRAFVQGSSPPTTDQVWEVYRHLGYRVDLEDRRGKDEQRVDEGLHLHIYKALCELSPRTLVVASGDGNKGKSECATSLPGCAQAAIERGWHVEVHSWKHSTSMEWHKLSKKYPDKLTLHFLDRYIKHITFVDGKYGRKCQPLPTDIFKSSNDYLN